MNMKNEKRIVITGIAPLCSIGIGKEALWKSVCEEKTHLVEEKFPIGDELSEGFFLHRMDEFDLDSFGFNPQILGWIRDWKNGSDDMDLMYLAAAVHMAIKDSRLVYDASHNDIGLILTHENPGLENFFDQAISSAYDFLQSNGTVDNSSSLRNPALKLRKKDLMEYVYSRCEKLGYDTQTFMYLFFTAKLFSIHGFSLLVNNACASGLFALEVASQQIRLNRCSAVVVAGADRPRMIYKHLWFKNNNLCAKDGLIKPFNKNRDGFVFGDGATGLVLEDLEHARARGASIYGEYLGGGFSLEGGKVTIPTVTDDYYAESAASALETSQVSVNEIDLVVPHGIGTAITDLHEARTISKVFKSAKDNHPLVTAFKPYFGHNLGGCALLETALLLLAMAHDYVPRTLNCEPVDPRIALNLARKSVKKKLNTTMKMSCGFAGFNGVGIFRKLEITK